MVERMDESGFRDAINDFLNFMRQEYSNVQFGNIDMWMEDEESVYDRRRKLLWSEYGFDEDVETNSCNCGGVFEETDLSEEEIQKAIEMYESIQSNAGRPSKTEKWAARIQSGDATLEEAKDALAQSTFYKMKREFDL